MKYVQVTFQLLQLLLGHKNGRVSSFSTSNGQFIAGCEVRGAEQPGVLVALEKHGR